MESGATAEDVTSEDSAVVVEESAGGRVLVALCLASFLAALNFFATTPFYPRMARDLDTTVPLLGQVVTLMILISAGLGLAVGPLADRYGYRRPLVVGVLAVALNLLGTGLAPAYPVLLVLSVIGGLADALVFGLPLAIAGTFFTGDARRRAIGWTIGSLSSASIAGVPLLTLIGAVAGWRAALVASGLVTVGAAWFIARALPADNRRSTTPPRVTALLAVYAPLLRHPPSLRLYGMTALRAACWIGLLTYLGAFLGDALGLSTRQIGLGYTLGGGGYAVGSIVAGRPLGRMSPRTLIALTSITTGVVVGVVLLLANVWVAAPLLLVASFASAIGGVGIVTLLAAETPVGTGTAMVLNGSLLNVGSAVGAALGGALLAVGGYDALGIGLPAFAFAAAVLAWWPSDR